MNIAMISNYLPSGSKIGSGHQAHAMANALVGAGHAVTMFSPCPRCEDSLYAHRVVYPGRHLRTFGFAWKLRKVDFSGFDVLHAHGDDYWLWRRRAPVHVRTMHGSCFAEAKHIPGFVGKLRMFLLGLSEVLATRVADRTVCVSRDTLRYYPGLRQVIPNGVDTSAFGPGQKDDAPTILFVGTFLNRKRGKLLYEAFCETIRPALPDARLWMVCGGVPEAPGVEVFGYVPLEKLTALYRRAWVFCLPSSYEGFGVPYIEAMASGTPVVATPNPGAREVLDGGVYGVLTTEKDLGQTLLTLLQDEPRRRQLAELGLARSRDYAWQNVVRQYEHVYDEVIQARGKSLAGENSQ